MAFGGGSVLDAAKAVALLMANPGQSVEELERADTLQPRTMPLVCVPTTAGTGSEATTVTVITDSRRHTKQLLIHESLMPDLAIIDAGLMLGVPQHITAATGMDVLTHAVEAYVADGALSYDDPHYRTLERAPLEASGSQFIIAELDGRLVGSVTWCPPGSSQREIALPDEGDTVALEIRAGGKTLFIFTACAEVIDPLRERLRGADLVFFDRDRVSAGADTDGYVFLTEVRAAF